MDTLPLGTSTEAGVFENNINLRHYWHVVLERRWLVITAFISVVLLSVIYLLRATPIFEATVRLQINRESENVLNIKDVFSVDGREQDYLQTQYKNLQSRTLISSIIKKLALDKDPRYSGKKDVALAVLDDISIVPLRLSRLVDIKVDHSDPKTAQKIASALANTFIDDNIAQKTNLNATALVFLQNEEKARAAALEGAEAALWKYRSTNNEVSLEEGENIARQALLQAQTELSKAQSASLQAQEVVTQIHGKLKAGGSVDSLPEVENNLMIQKLKEELHGKEAVLQGLLVRYKEKHPAVMQAREEVENLRESIKREANFIVNSLELGAEIAKNNEAKQSNYLSGQKDEQMKLNQLRIQYDVLKRQADNNKAIYNVVLSRMKETELTAKISNNNIRIVDDADVPLKPVKPKKVLTVFLGIFGGIAMALGLAFFVNYLDDSIKTQDDVETYLRLPFLGYVPNIKTNSVVERDLQAHLHPQSNAAEGFRTIRATVSLTQRAEKFRVISITSTIPSEGKSLVASNFAIVTAQTGLKTVLVDADLRRPSVHKAYQLHSPIGLSSYLTDEVKNVDELIHTTEVPNLDVVCCGAVPSTPSELIGSKKMAEFLQMLRNRYDRVVLDCPPISAVSDPLVISAMSDGIIFVTKFNKIRREHARKSIQRIQNAGIHVVGVVLNDIDFEGKDSYYYSYYYYQNRYYSSHYKTNPEVSEPKFGKS